MAIFTRYALTRGGEALIAKAHKDHTTIRLTGFITGSGLWGENEDLEYATALKQPRQRFAFSDISIPSGNLSTVVLTVNITNEGLSSLYYLNEAGIMADDGNGEEIIYACLATESQSIYVPAYNGMGFSNIVQRFNLEVANAASVVINMDGAHVSAAEYTTFRNNVIQIVSGLLGGATGQYLKKRSDLDNEYGWADSNVIARPLAAFPEEGQADAIYVDTDSSEIYVWKKVDDEYQYFKLPLGAEASETLQAQITANREAIELLKGRTSALEGKFAEIDITIAKTGWTEGTSGTVAIYTQEIEVTGMTTTLDAEVWPKLLADTAAGIVAEKKAAALFFGKGTVEGMTGKVKLTCYEKCPQETFGLTIKGVGA